MSTSRKPFCFLVGICLLIPNIALAQDAVPSPRPSGSYLLGVGVEHRLGVGGTVEPQSGIPQPKATPTGGADECEDESCAEGNTTEDPTPVDPANDVIALDDSIDATMDPLVPDYWQPIDDVLGLVWNCGGFEFDGPDSAANNTKAAGKATYTCTSGGYVTTIKACIQVRKNGSWVKLPHSCNAKTVKSNDSASVNVNGYCIPGNKKYRIKATGNSANILYKMPTERGKSGGSPVFCRTFVAPPVLPIPNLLK